jgi:heme-degrading monooxygenase HmoA
MYARVTMGVGKPGSSDESARIHRDSVAPACKAQKGFKGLYLFSNAKANKSMTITLWETEADMNAAEASGFYQAQVAKFKDVLTAVPVREEYEVVLAP